MQKLDLSRKKNTSEWHVIHDKTTRLYIVRNRQGTELGSKYDSRKRAEAALEMHLRAMETPSLGRPGRKTKEELATFSPSMDRDTSEKSNDLEE